MTKQAKITTGTAIDAQVQNWPLADTYVSEHNPRFDEPVDEASNEELAQTIIASGLIQNLCGLMDANGKVGIVAGRRRWNALQLAVLERPELATIDIKITSDLETALSWAMLENTQREEMDVVDEIRAYSSSRKSGLKVAQIAKAYCATEAHVYRRLALGDLPAPVLDSLKAGNISMDCAKAFTKSYDEDLILQVLEQAEESGYWGAYQITSALNGEKLDADCRAMSFVGLDAYKEAGGTLDTNLFDDDATVNDSDLLDRLFTEKLNDAAADIQLSERFAWVETHDGSHVTAWDLRAEFGFVSMDRIEGDMTDDQKTRYDELKEKSWWQYDEDEKAEREALDEIKKGDFSDAQRALFGAYVYVNRQGTVSTVTGLVRDEHKGAAVEAGFIQIEEKTEAGTAASEPVKSPFSQVFLDDMKAIRLAAVQTALLDKPDFLLSLFAFAVSPASGGSNGVFGFGYGATERNKPSVDDQFNLDPRLGGEMDEEAEQAYEVFEEMAALDKVDAFKAYRAVGKKVRNGDITAFLARAFLTQRGGFMADIEAEIDADMRLIWTPSAENCFKRLKGWQLDALYMSLLDLHMDTDDYRAFSKSKKGAKNEAMHKLFNDPEHQKACRVTEEQKTRIDAWIPECF